MNESLSPVESARSSDGMKRIVVHWAWQISASGGWTVWGMVAAQEVAGGRPPLLQEAVDKEVRQPLSAEWRWFENRGSPGK